MGIKRKLGIVGLAVTGIFVLFIIVGVIVVTSLHEEQERLQSPEISLDGAVADALYDVEYDALLRFNEEYVGEIVYYRGDVVQVIHRYDDVYVLFIRPDTTARFDNDKLAVQYSGPRIIEDDLVKMYGVVTGLYEGETVLGAQTVYPAIDALYILQDSDR